MTFHVCFENDAKVRLSLSKHQENEFTKSSHFHEEPEKVHKKFTQPLYSTLSQILARQSPFHFILHQKTSPRLHHVSKMKVRVTHLSDASSPSLFHITDKQQRVNKKFFLPLVSATF